ncbi:tetratricopeptide repeat protein [Microbacterium amylolyticum]|uniref:Thioredoxin n=1 Tax=Microbacterium amylolyticum TaxID=936337 RepID=A0ABS4ZEW7_9MICO|nr:tetratricopeptide repeat protein [Microbacterium amylolyticum]MBP2435752.1 putative thioredoxin [Microbacterium amylolyticum]
MSDASLGSALRGAVDLSSLRNRPQTQAPGAARPGQAVTPGPAGAQGADVVMAVGDDSFGQVMELSVRVPVVVQLWAPQVPETVEQGALLEKVARSMNGRIALARVDATRAPQVAQMFQQNGWPMTIGVIGQRPVPVPDQQYSEEQLVELFGQILQLGQQAGITGTLDVAAGDDEQAAPEEPALSPLQQEAYDAIERGDYDAAIAAYEKGLKENPRDDEAKAGLAQVHLLKRTTGADLAAVRQAAADGPDNVDAQLAVADLDVIGGHVDDAFDRLLDLFSRVFGDERAVVKDRLVELFGVVGTTDPRVVSARARLTSLLF